MGGICTDKVDWSGGLPELWLTGFFPEVFPPSRRQTGDFDGDGREDLIAFLNLTYSDARRGDVYVALSNGRDGFDPPALWMRLVLRLQASQICKVGDFDGDGRDDVFSLTRRRRRGHGATWRWRSRLAPASRRLHAYRGASTAATGRTWTSRTWTATGATTSCSSARATAPTRRTATWWCCSRTARARSRRRRRAARSPAARRRCRAATSRWWRIPSGTRASASTATSATPAISTATARATSWRSGRRAATCSTPGAATRTPRAATRASASPRHCRSRWTRSSTTSSTPTATGSRTSWASTTTAWCSGPSSCATRAAARRS
jgi:hypothetical protein